MALKGFPAGLLPAAFIRPPRGNFTQGLLKMRLFFLSLIFLTSAACGSSDTTGPDDKVLTAADVAGVYTLKTVAGLPLPYNCTFQGVKYAVVSDVLTLRSDKSWSETSSHNIVGTADTEVLSDSGTFSLNGDKVMLFVIADPTADYHGTYSKNTLSIVGFDGTIQLFVR